MATNRGSERRTIEVSFSASAERSDAQRSTFTATEGAYQKFPYTYTAKEDSDEAKSTDGKILTIRVVNR
ncbi:hypothetical protein [Pelagicoccus sp. SDUM812002]|uniref:hypothetical protein n=1 Tax=Pelagicoccus sp. SDUM812002 TaxID=3041266 RepID=UPI00280DE6D0|nr:hypothetical protein [Pelagicoccus sp. SDUM812002]MDQ8184485.1 hypothetical protein [Pelagicoccus sp. SDUM812002]